MSRKRSAFRSPFLWFLILCFILVVSGAVVGDVVFNNGVGRAILGFILVVLVVVGCWVVEKKSLLNALMASLAAWLSSLSSSVSSCSGRSS